VILAIASDGVMAGRRYFGGMAALRRLEQVIPAAPGKPPPDPDHPMRKVTLQVAFDEAGWSPDRAAGMGQIFDGLAADWHTRMTADRHDAVHDALARGGPWPARAPWLELGSGIGIFSPAIAKHSGGDQVIAADLSLEMLKRAPAEPPRLQADASSLPFADNTFGVIWLINMLLFPSEMARVLRTSDGVLVWVNTIGSSTPIHLAPDEVERALPGTWDGVYADAGWGTWTILRQVTSRTGA
jgi:hypothetical protein